MTTRALEGSWLRLKSQLKRSWSKLTEGDLVAIRGDHTHAAVRIQMRYGSQREAAQTEWAHFCENYSRGLVATGKE
ncbi:MAG: hypothetical protein ACE37K_18430 [Planctomycetota bacterium]